MPKMRLPGVKCPKKKEMKRGIPWLSMRKAKIEDLELRFRSFGILFMEGRVPSPLSTKITSAPSF